MHCEYEMWSLKMHGDSEKPNIQTKCKYIYGNDLDKIAVNDQMIGGGQERPLMGFSEFFPFSLHGHVGGPITFQSTLRRYVSPAYYPISNRLCDDYWYKHCTQLYQSSCKQRSDCKLP